MASRRTPSPSPRPNSPETVRLALEARLDGRTPLVHGAPLPVLLAVPGARGGPPFAAWGLATYDPHRRPRWALHPPAFRWRRCCGLAPVRAGVERLAESLILAAPDLEALEDPDALLAELAAARGLLVPAQLLSRLLEVTEAARGPLSFSGAEEVSLDFFQGQEPPALPCFACGKDWTGRGAPSTAGALLVDVEAEVRAAERRLADLRARQARLLEDHERAVRVEEEEEEEGAA